MVYSGLWWCGVGVRDGMKVWEMAYGVHGVLWGEVWAVIWEGGKMASLFSCLRIGNGRDLPIVVIHIIYARKVITDV
jgi:hypothetical protein